MGGNAKVEIKLSLFPIKFTAPLNSIMTTLVGNLWVSSCTVGWQFENHQVRAWALKGQVLERI